MPVFVKEGGKVMNRNLGMLGGLCLGAGLMYLLDPDRGNRRRALIRDKTVHCLNQTGDFLDAATNDFRNRASGTLAELNHLFVTDHASDAVVVARVRARMGRIIRHPRAIEVSANQGRVTLRGPILREEADVLTRSVSFVRGVQSVEDRLERYDQPGDIPALQGQVRQPEQVQDYMQANWSPATRLMACIAGGVLGMFGMKQKGVMGTLLGCAGLGLMSRGATNREMKQLVGMGSGRCAVELQKSLHINAPVDVVFAFWTNYDNFPHFMTNVKEVREGINGRSHWVVKGPAGIPIEWDAEITRIEQNRELGWKTLSGSVVEHAGLIRFEDNFDGTTQVHIQMSYNPPAGVLGHTVADLLGFDPKTKMDVDLARMKTLIETGKTPRHSAWSGAAEV